MEALSLCRDEDCPHCGYPETYYKIEYGEVVEIGCHDCGWYWEAD